MYFLGGQEIATFQDAGLCSPDTQQSTLITPSSQGMRNGPMINRVPVLEVTGNLDIEQCGLILKRYVIIANPV